MLDTYTLFGVEFNLLDLIMAILLLGTGIYCIYTSIRVRREYTFFENKVLLPGGCEAANCTDPNGFFDYIAPRLVLFGIALIFCAALDLLVLFLVRRNFVGGWLYWAQLVVPFGCFGWYIYLQRKAGKLFW